MSCEYCEIVEKKSGAAKLYEDDKVIAFLADKPATIGHVIIAPKKHSPILESVSDEDLEKVFKTANKISIALFESIRCEGTNLIIHNGIEAGQEAPHFSVNIIARRNDDGFFLEWAPKQLSEEEMSTIELKLKEDLAKKETPAQPKEPEKPKEEPKKDDTKKEEIKDTTEEPKKETPKEDKEENYLIRQLRRMP